MLADTFMVLGCVAFAIFILWGLSKAVGQVRPSLWIVLGVLFAIAALTGPRTPANFGPSSTPLEPSPCKASCPDSVPADIGDSNIRFRCLKRCEHAEALTP